MTEIQLKPDFDVEPIQHTGDDLMIAKAAWVSTGNEEPKLREGQTLEDCVEGVLKFLIKHRHGTPFEHGSLTLRVNIPVFLWREWHRHRIGFSYNEQSGRYQKLDPVFYVPSDERYQHCIKPEGWKPSKPGFRGMASTDVKMTDSLRDSYRYAYEAYEYYMQRKIDNGLARIVLPVGIYSACYVTCNPRSLMSFLSLRVDSEDATIPSHPQWEMHKVATQVEEIFSRLWPITHRLWVGNGRVSP